MRCVLLAGWAAAGAASTRWPLPAYSAVWAFVALPLLTCTRSAMLPVVLLGPPVVPAGYYLKTPGQAAACECCWRSLPCRHAAGIDSRPHPLTHSLTCCCVCVLQFTGPQGEYKADVGANGNWYVLTEGGAGALTRVPDSHAHTHSLQALTAPSNAAHTHSQHQVRAGHVDHS
jgi:hypothetical protein